MMVGNLMKKKEHLPVFSFEYFTDEENCLVGLFWSDGESKRNYQVFSDIMSFDATYRSNRYSMVFVPFTGIDNHNNNVSFGAALLASETAETYKWLLRCFLKHLVGLTLCNTIDFKQRICDIVWTDSLSPSEFEVGWHSVIQDFDLSDNNWLGDIYDMRESWIPAYYRDELMPGLMRTTSRSESENHFFGQKEAIVKAGKKSRQCQNCKEYGHYASTCSKPPKKTGVNTKEKTFDTMSADS
ncbi:hypothetical protein QVD17_38164 [Tagetes erecta]|uniref:MULE transposase domain-containing protein n=1 Tax=Tagetes erecta TaxID=13708 RepID=A0AAD8JVI0_TARER|nr:hypothetical protein QVD17_38164 [Tagetes erecta]